MKAIKNSRLAVILVSTTLLIPVLTGCGKGKIEDDTTDQTTLNPGPTDPYNGLGPFGEFGDNDTQVSLATPWANARIAAGNHHSCVINTSGGVRCWGKNDYGQLGDGTQTSSSKLVKVKGLDNGIVAIAANGNHTCALSETGRVRCWGDNSHGQVGYSAHGAVISPNLVKKFKDGGAIGLAVGANHSCAIHEAGSLWCWGNNSYGQLGNTSVTQDTHEAVRVSKFTSAGSTSTSSSGGGGTSTIQVGSNFSGVLSTNIVTTIGTSAGVVATATPKVTGVALGERHSCAIDNSGNLWCWGSNANGRLGDGTSTTRTEPVKLAGLSGIKLLSLGYKHTCAVDASSTLQCWGSNQDGQLGQGGGADSKVPLPVVGLSVTPQSVVSGAYHTCVTDGGSAISCWGRNDVGELGNGSYSSMELVPTSMSGVAGPVRAIAAGAFHGCMLNANGAQCWGNDHYGQLGDGETNTSHNSPVQVLNTKPASQ